MNSRFIGVLFIIIVVSALVPARSHADIKQTHSCADFRKKLKTYFLYPVTNFRLSVVGIIVVTLYGADDDYFKSS